MAYLNDGFLDVYVDGACFHNGCSFAKAGWGANFPNNNHLNSYGPVSGKATNNNAEIEAIINAAKIATDKGATNLRIYTDSKFILDSVHRYMKKWKSNGWKTVTGGPVKNKEKFMEMNGALSAFNEVEWEHVYAHQNCPDNEEADRLAKLGAKEYVVESHHDDSYLDADEYLDSSDQNSDDYNHSSDEGSYSDQNSDDYSNSDQNSDQDSYSDQNPDEDSYSDQNPDDDSYSDQDPDDSYSDQNPDEDSYSDQNPDDDSYSDQNPDEDSYSDQNPDEDSYSDQNPDEDSYSDQNPDENSYSDPFSSSESD